MGHFHLNFNDKKLMSAITKYVENECVSDSEQYRDFWTVIENVSVLLKII